MQHEEETDSLGWLVEFIAKFLQFQPEVEQKFFSCQRTSAEPRVGIKETSRLIEKRLSSTPRSYTALCFSINMNTYMYPEPV